MSLRLRLAQERRERLLDGMDRGERLRQLVAARDGRYRQERSSRYAIEGEKRPDRRVREALINAAFITWPQHYATGLVAITPEGEAHLDLIEGQQP